MRLFLSLGLVVAVTACSAPAPEVAAPAEPTAAPAAVVEDAADALRTELARAQHEVVQLKNQLREQQGQIETAYAEAERYQRGLDRCVAKLNEVAADAHARAAGAYAPPMTQGRSRGTARVSTLSAPWASIVGDSAVVSVRLWNGGDGDASGFVDLELVCAGSVVDSSREPVEISARTDATVSATLRTSGSESNCTGRARLSF